MMPRSLGAAMAVWLRHAFFVAARYGQPPCQGDDVQGELQGASGNLCAARCETATFNCPVDVPYGSSAQPQCMLKDVDQAPYCALLCQLDQQCPSGSQCRHLQQIEVGVCLFPVSFTDWARSAVTRKFAVGWPKSSGVIAGVQIAKTYAALQNLKAKHSISDGDADMVTLKEFLSALPSGSTAGAPSSGGSGAFSLGSNAAPAPPPNSASWWNAGDFAPSQWKHDAKWFVDNVAMNPHGIQKEVDATIWNIEHINKRGVATMFFRSFLLCACVYLMIGCCIKSQLQGARGIEMVPHIGFWREYPGLVSDGITYAQMLAGGWLGLPSKGMSDDLSGGLGGRGMPTRGVGSFESL